MACHHFTLRITRTTDVPRAISLLDAELLRTGIDNTALTTLVQETGMRFQRELLSRSSSHSDTRSNPHSNSHSNSHSSSADTLLRGESYRIRITTRQQTMFEALCMHLLPRRTTFS